MQFSNLKIGVRLALGFLVVLVLMALIVTVGIMRLSSVGQLNTQLTGADWTKSQAAQVIDSLTRANTRRAMELVLFTDEAHANRTNAFIDANKKTIDEALGTLDRLILTTEGRRLLDELRAERGPFLASLQQVRELSAAGRRAEAQSVIQDLTLPAIDILQETVRELVAFQDNIVTVSGAETQRSIETAITLIVALGVAAVIASILVAYATTRSITRPLARAVQVAETVAAGDLTSQASEFSRDETGQLLRALQEMNDGLVRIIGQVREGADTIATASGQIAAGNTDLSSRTEEQASALEETAASMEELTATVRQNADNAKQANQLARSASTVATEGGDVVQQVVQSMRSIHESSHKIVDIISVIDGIAFQTNILALNAAVEAARAGEQGRGFAVVASEVRNLAQRSAMAAREVKELIDSSVGEIDAGTLLVEKAGTTMREVVDGIVRVTDIMGEISAATQEQSSGIDQVGQAITQMDQVTQQNAALVEEAAAASESMQSQASRLAQAVGTFRLRSGAVMESGVDAGPASAPRREHRGRGQGLRPALATPADTNWREF